MKHSYRHLILILGDQLSLDSPVLRHANTSEDVVWSAEGNDESTHVWTNYQPPVS